MGLPFAELIFPLDELGDRRRLRLVAGVTLVLADDPISLGLETGCAAFSWRCPVSTCRPCWGYFNTNRLRRSKTG